MPNKEIPEEIVDKGCIYWDNEKAVKLTKQIVMTFDGELL
tara:strand:- start:2275 stop:2394 length:120 start_codon:yes stop_codon:yes gene_type:complete